MSKQVLRNLFLMLGLTVCLLAGILGMQSKAGHAAPELQAVPAGPARLVGLDDRYAPRVTPTVNTSAEGGR